MLKKKDKAAELSRSEVPGSLPYVWKKIQELNKAIDEQKPWELAKAGKTEELQDVLNTLVSQMLSVAHLLEPFLPQTAEKIEAVFASGEITPPKTPLFPKNSSSEKDHLR